MKILISGAGIAGSTLAYLLSRLDHQVTVLERSKQFLGQGQNIDISSGALTILKKMGVLDEVRKWNTTEKGTIFLGQDGKPVGTFPVNPQGPSPTAEFEILRGDLALILYNAAKTSPNVEYRFGTMIDELVSNDDMSVKLKFNDGSVHDYDIAIAADGQGSKLRRVAFKPESTRVIDRQAYIMYWTIPKQPSDTEWWYIYWGLERRVLSLRPDPHGTMRASITKIPLDDAEREEWKAACRSDRKVQAAIMEKYFANAGWQTRRFLDAVPDAPDFYMHHLEQIKMDKWSTGRVVCVGDAAYAPTPITGMGTTLAIMGAYLLAGELSKLQQDEQPAKAFDAFEKIFHAHTEKVQDIPSFVPGIAHPSSKWHLWTLQTAISVASKVLQVPLISRAFGERGSGSNEKNFPMPDFKVLDSKLPGVVAA